MIGMMGSGKTSTARELGVLLKMPVIDLDAELENYTAMSVTEIFKKKGEPWFRERETTALVSHKADRATIFATGGGVVLSRQNREWMRAAGSVVFLETSLETIWKRVSKEADGRPLLKDMNPKRKLMSILTTRLPLYVECAHIQVNTDGKSPKEVAHEILKLIKPA